MIRPKAFSEFHGQSSALAQLRMAVRASIARKRQFGHTLLVGPSGVGKTTLGVSVLPSELSIERVHMVNCTAVEDLQALLPTVTTCSEGSLLFLDEVHALPRECMEALYHVLEDRSVSVSIGDGRDKRVIQIALPSFTVVCATTRLGLLPEPFVNRFEHQVQLDVYSVPELVMVLRWTLSRIADAMDADDDALQMLAVACQGTARHAQRLLNGAIDTAIVYGNARIDATCADDTLRRLGYAGGLTQMQVKLLGYLTAQSRATGLSTLSAFLCEEPRTIEDTVEPHLLREGLMLRTTQGRLITDKGQQLCQSLNL